MDTARKQRLVGIMVIISLGIIFLPSLFHRDSQERTIVDTQSVIPPKPKVRTIVIDKPESERSAEQSPALDPDEAFQPPTDNMVVSKNSIDEALQHSEPITPQASSETITKSPNHDHKEKENLSLDAKGLPISWVIQVASFQSEEHAQALMKKLRGTDFKAYVRSVNTAKGQFFRVLIGPYISKAKAEADKVKVDKSYKVKGQILRFSSK